MTRRSFLYALWVGVISLALFFLFVRSGFDFNYIIPKRLIRLTTMLLGGVCIAWSSIVFQTITGNRILTPAIMGYEAIYLLLQALLILMMGTQSLLLGQNGNFFLSIFLMLAYSWFIHQWLFVEGKNNVYLLLLVGLVLTMVMNSLTQFAQLKVSPGEFSILLSFSQTSFDNSEPAQVLTSGILLLVIGLIGRQFLPSLDVLALGREQAIALGIDYARTVKRLLAFVAALTAISTSLLGPSAFIGLFVANTAYALAGTCRHRAVLPIGCAIAIGMFILAQLAVEHAFNYRTTVGILINLVCGVWFLALMMRAKSTP